MREPTHRELMNDVWCRSFLVLFYFVLALLCKLLSYPFTSIFFYALSVYAVLQVCLSMISVQTLKERVE